MVPYRFSKVRIESFATYFPDTVVSSTEIEDRVAPLYQRLGIPFGTLERLSGIENRRLWKPDYMPSAGATIAATEALDKAGIDRSQITALFSCSVSRDYFEPATACIVHSNLGLSEECMAMDITNACIGFTNGLMTMAQLIESGAVKVGLVVSCENVSKIVESTIHHLQKITTMTRDEMIKVLPVLTLGCGAVAYVLTHESVSKSSHKLLGGVAKSATEHKDLCNGNGDFNVAQNEITPLMYTEANLLISNASKLGSRIWPETSKLLGWNESDINHIFCHQVGRQVNTAFYKEMGLDVKKEFTIYEQYGNMVSAAMPAALAIGSTQKKSVKEGDKILATAYGSGLNGLFWGVQW